MNAADVILAAALLAGPAAAPEPEPDPAHWPALQAALHHVAVDRELMGENERHYLFAKRDEFGTDLEILRRRTASLADAPPLCDVDRLPEKWQAVERVRFNRAFRRSLEDRQAIEPDRADELQEVIRETDQLYRVWDAVRDARCDFLYVAQRRLALKKLRDLVGPDAYARGELPSNVPTWRLADSK